MFDKSKLIILITGTNIEPYDKNWKECESTWIPELRKMGYTVKVAIGVSDLTNYYMVDGDIIYFRADESKDGLFDKSVHLPIKWILEETNYEYYFRIDSDSFVAPLRFENMLNENFEKYPNVDYMGCSIPVDTWWDTEPSISWPITYFVHMDGMYASGCAYFISKKAMIAAHKDMKVTDVKELQWDDLVLGRALCKNNIPLLHDSRILLHSKYNVGFTHPNRPMYDISTPKSFLAIQHYMNGHMEEAMISLGYRK
jgi:hypothetical protein